MTMMKMIKTARGMSVRAIALANGARYAVAFETGKPGWKMDGDKLALDANGNPIYLDSAGNEQAVEGTTISRLNGEAKTHREAKERAEAALEPYKLADGKYLDPATAKTAIDKLGKIDQKQLIDAGEVDKVRDEISKGFTAQLTEKDAALKDANGRVDQLTLERAFDRSKFIADRVAVPADMFQSTFGRHFKVEDGKVVPYGADGNKVYSKTRMGEIADMDEALSIIIETYPDKDRVLKAPDAAGTGNNGNGGNRGQGRTVRRADFEALPPGEQAAMAGKMNTGEVTIVD